jgi:tetratricopeptide (TPR) repeat protein
MRQRLEFLLASVMELPPHYFYAAWMCGLMLIVAFFYFGDEEVPPKEFGPTNRQLSATEPDIVGPARKTYEQLELEAPRALNDHEDLEARLGQLEDYIAEFLLGNEKRKPEWISAGLTASGMDRGSLQDRYQSDSIKVRRWRRSATAPSYASDDVLENFIDSCFQPWRDCEDLSVEIQSYQTQVDSDATTINLIVECSGLINSDTGMQSTGIWMTKWSPGVSQRQLIELAVLAQEEVVSEVYQGKVFRDCTASILQRCDCLEEQLVFSLDQWAQRIPNIDVAGRQGLAVGDINQDGLVDVYVCQPHGLPNKLLIQNPDGTVDDVSTESNVDFLDATYAVLMIDLDNDRDQDLVLTTDEGLLLLSNKGDNTFQLEHSLAIGRHAETVSAADYDQDGDLDLFLCKYRSVEQTPRLLELAASFGPSKQGGRNVLLRNNEGWEFEDVTERVGFTTENNEPTRSAVWVDFDFDGDADLFLCNDFTSNRIYRNDDGWFSDITDQLGIENDARYRTASVGDFDMDGKFDFFAGTMVSPATLRASNRTTATNDTTDREFNQDDEMLTGEDLVLFGDSAERFRPFFLRAPLFSCGTANGSVTADINKDGMDDIVISNGLLSRSRNQDLDDCYAIALYSQAPTGSLTKQNANDIEEVLQLLHQGFSFSGYQRNKCLLSIGKLGFANLSNLTGMDSAIDARGIASADWDNDGDVDILMTCRTGPQFRIFCNQLITENGFVSFELEGTESNADAIGSRIELYIDGSETPMVKTLQAGSGYLSQSSKQIVFGVASGKRISKAAIVWPNGNREEYNNLVINSQYRAVEASGKLAEKSTGRFKFSIDGQYLFGPKSPPDSGRSAFYPTSALPRLLFRGTEDNYYPIETIDDQPLALIFFSRDNRSKSVLSEFKNAARLLNSSNLDCLAVYCDPIETPAEQKWESASLMVGNSKFPFRWGLLTEASNDKLKLAAGEWFGIEQMPPMPFALLLTADNQVSGYYPTGTLDPKTILADKRRFELDVWSRAEFVSPFGGRWANRYRYRNFRPLIDRLIASGYEKDVERLQKRSKEFLAYQFCQQAIELASRDQLLDAKAQLGKSIALNQDCILAHLEMGKVCRQIALKTPGIDEADKVLFQQLAKDHFNLASQLDVTNPQAIIGRANIAIDQGDVDEAIQLLTDYIKFEPERFEVHALIGRLRFYQQHYREAAKYLVAAFENRPSLPYVAGDLGFLYLQAGQFREARSFLQLANRLQPSDKNMLRLLAEAEYSTNNFEDAIDRFSKVITIDPSRRRPKLLYAWLLATCPYEHKRDAGRALQVIKPLVDAENGRSPVVLEIQAAAYAEQGYFDDALKLQAKAVELIENSTGIERYTAEQKEGMLARQELYRRGRPYRTEKVMRAPVTPPFASPTQ